jgi:transcriptional regulator GlxA family with amidase domain
MSRPSDSAIPDGSAATASGAGPARRPVVTCADIETALAYISRHACDNLTAARVAMETQQVSLATFSRHFRAATGLTLKDAIRQRQLEEVRRLLLRTELSAEYIAAHCGFRDARAAARAFVATGSDVPVALRRAGGKNGPPEGRL